ncbi:sugar ABC transporter substrate-binding protein [Vulcanisaeta souniana JCM 11219]|uniref:Sugar ABC transporter substrate-binding protein n=1 Tax=Vulcanisaeta souniana JCM 11219 TaxID=1293586 RepID=A0A830E4C9_9CREN|nr:sugar ABC transporter substrate-binding protein [Vulcanisaeta souniana JCM 11219]
MSDFTPQNAYNSSFAQTFCSTVGSVTITVWDTYSVSEDEAFNASLASFEQLYPCIHVEVTYGVGIATSNFISAAKAGQAPIVYRDSSDDAGKLFAAGLLLNLSEYLPPSVFDQYLPTAAQNFYLSTPSAHGYYGLPDNINYIVMFYNKQYMSSPPNTTDQLINMCLQVNSTYHVWCIAYGVGSEWGYRFAAWFAGFGGQIFGPNDMPQLNSSAMVNALEFWYNLTYGLHINAPDMSPSLEGQLFTSNETAIIFDGPWDLGTYFKALGCNLGAAPLPVVSQTGLHASPFIGSTGWVIASPQASGATPQQLEAALVFILYMTGPQADLNLWNYAHDIPANLQAYNQAVSQLETGQLSPSCLNGIMEGIFAQAQYGQKFPNIPAMAYYWNAFHQYATAYFANQTTAQAAAQGMEQYMLQQIAQSGG